MIHFLNTLDVPDHAGGMHGERHSTNTLLRWIRTQFMTEMPATTIYVHLHVHVYVFGVFHTFCATPSRRRSLPPRTCRSTPDPWLAPTRISWWDTTFPWSSWGRRRLRRCRSAPECSRNTPTGKHMLDCVKKIISAKVENFSLPFQWLVKIPAQLRRMAFGGQ